MNSPIATEKNFFQIQLFSHKYSNFYIIKFIPSWQISPEATPDPYQSDLYQGYCDYVGAHYQELPLLSRNHYLARLNKYDQIPGYINGCFLALKNSS
ncbi:MAG: hypothetical protein QNJ54_34840 [Prochloraceae cyanobacterium]|nr:hypothetical protein [Prochloraceae cyanobacterium]